MAKWTPEETYHLRERAGVIARGHATLASMSWKLHMTVLPGRTPEAIETKLHDFVVLERKKIAQREQHRARDRKYRRNKQQKALSEEIAVSAAVGTPTTVLEQADVVTDCVEVVTDPMFFDPDDNRLEH